VEAIPLLLPAYSDIPNCLSDRCSNASLSNAYRNNYEHVFDGSAHGCGAFAASADRSSGIGSVRSVGARIVVAGVVVGIENRIR
jgi:hypothetical protein